MPETRSAPLVELRERLARSEWPVLLLLSLILAGLGAHGVTLGLSSHGDSRAIVENSIPAILHGSYVPSRTLGNPLYEAICALLYGTTGSLAAVNCYSLVLTIAALFIFAGLLDQSLSFARRSLVLAGFALNPLVLINSSALIEWMQMTLLLVILLAGAKTWLDHRRTRDLFVYGSSSALLVLTRPDAIIVCVAVLLALLWEIRFARRDAFQLFVANIVAGVVTATIFVAINHGIGFIHSYDPSNDSLMRRVGVATMGAINIFGPLGLAVITFLAFNLAHKALSQDRTEISWWGRLFLVAGPLFVARFIVLPTKLEYILPFVIVAVLAVAHERLALRWVAVVTISMIVTSAVCVSLFERNGGADQLRVAINVNRGALAQDWEVTRFNRLVTNQRFLDKLADLIYAGEPAPRPHLHAVNFAIGIISDENDLIIGKDQVYRLDDERFPLPMYKRKTYRRIYVCGGSLREVKPGWRVLQRPPTFPLIDPATDQLILHCSQEGTGTGRAREGS